MSIEADQNKAQSEYVSDSIQIIHESGQDNTNPVQNQPNKDESKSIFTGKLGIPSYCVTEKPLERRPPSSTNGHEDPRTIENSPSERPRKEDKDRRKKKKGSKKMAVQRKEKRKWSNFVKWMTSEDECMNKKVGADSSPRESEDLTSKLIRDEALKTWNFGNQLGIVFLRNWSSKGQRATQQLMGSRRKGKILFYEDIIIQYPWGRE